MLASLLLCMTFMLLNQAQPSAVAGVATHFNSHGPGLYGAAGPELRQMLGRDWKGQTVEVTSGGAHVKVKLITSCACGDRSYHGRIEDTVIDLSLDAFLVLAPQGSGPNPGWQGVIPVRVRASTPVDGPTPTLPPTDTE